MALLSNLGMQSASFLQLNFVDRQITGATKLLLSMLEDAVLLGMVGATERGLPL